LVLVKHSDHSKRPRRVEGGSERGETSMTCFWHRKGVAGWQTGPKFHGGGGGAQGIKVLKEGRPESGKKRDGKARGLREKTSAYWDRKGGRILVQRAEVLAECNGARKILRAFEKKAIEPRKDLGKKNRRSGEGSGFPAKKTGGGARA